MHAYAVSVAKSLKLRVRQGSEWVEAPLVVWKPQNNEAHVALEGRLTKVTLSDVLAENRWVCDLFRDRPGTLPPLQAAVLVNACARSDISPGGVFREMLDVLAHYIINSSGVTDRLREEIRLVRARGYRAPQGVPPTTPAVKAMPPRPAGNPQLPHQQSKKKNKKQKDTLQKKEQRPATWQDIEALRNRQEQASREQAQKLLAQRRARFGMAPVEYGFQQQAAKAGAVSAKQRQREFLERQRWEALSAHIHEQQRDAGRMDERSRTEQVTFRSTAGALDIPFKILLLNQVMPVTLEAWLPQLDEVRVRMPDGQQLYTGLTANLTRNEALIGVITDMTGRLHARHAALLVKAALRNQELMGRSTERLFQLLEGMVLRVKRSRTLEPEERASVLGLVPVLERQRHHYIERYGGRVESAPLRDEFWELILSSRERARQPKPGTAMKHPRRYEWARESYVDELGRVRGVYTYNVSDLK